MDLLSFFNFNSKSLKMALRNGAVIIDVRLPREYDEGKIRGSKNIPVDQITVNANYLKGLNKPVIVVSSSGAESAEAKRILKEAGVAEVYNGGSWERVLRLLQSL